jgi:uncharacterized membrane protein (DUF106 family)
VNGVLNLAYPLFDLIDGLIGALPDAVRLILWGAISGIAAMFLYKALSSQERIKALQAESKALRQRMMATDDAGEATKLAGANLKLSMRTLGTVTGPAMLSGIPVIFVLAWISATFATSAPAPGAPVALESQPATVTVGANPPADGANGPALSWPGTGTPITLQDSTGVIYDAPAEDPPAWIVHKKRWWNVLLGNPAGYLADSAAADTVIFKVPDREILGFGPGWMRGWAFTYLMSLLVVSLLIKFVFRIA